MPNDIASPTLPAPVAVASEAAIAAETEPLPPWLRRYIDALNGGATERQARIQAGCASKDSIKLHLHSNPSFARAHGEAIALRAAVGVEALREIALSRGARHLANLDALAYNEDPTTGKQMREPIVTYHQDGTSDVVGYRDKVAPQQRIVASDRMLQAAGLIGSGSAAQSAVLALRVTLSGASGQLAPATIEAVLAAHGGSGGGGSDMPAGVKE